MKRKEYREFLQYMLYDMDLRRIQMTDIYKTNDYLFTEYHMLFTEGNTRIYTLFKDFSLGSEMEFYLKLDMLTYLPFEKLGYDYLNKKLENDNLDVVKFNYNRIIKLLNDSKTNIEEELDNNIKYFLNNYYNDVIEINIIGLVLILLRLFHRYVLIMNFGGPLAVVTIHKRISKVMDKMINDIKVNNLKEININDYLEDFDYSDKHLNEDMIKYLEYCLERES